MQIRPCTADDLLALRAGWPTYDDVHGAHFADQGDGGATYLVAWDGPDPLGSLMVQWHGCIGANARSAYPAAVAINHLQVRPEHRGRGVGTALLAAAEAAVLGQGHALVALGVSEGNDAAARLYSRLGYQRTAVIDVSSYRWTDDAGTVHDATDRDELLVKRLG